LVFISVLELLCFQKDAETKRRTLRKEKGVQMMKEGKMREAVMYFQTLEVRGHQPCHGQGGHPGLQGEEHQHCIVADSQLAFLNMAGLADIVITVDIDLTLFG
jgi:hypothetical protein